MGEETLENNDLMRIWNGVDKTDPSATKKNNQGGFKSTSVNGYWFIQQATKLWGPIGTTWGYEIIEDRLTDGAPILNDDGEVICKSQMHTIKLRLWYPGCTNEGVVNYGHTPYIYNSKHGPICDMEAPKKSLTDALKKCLSFLGFCSDIYMGEFDDASYVEMRQQEVDLEKAENKLDEQAKQRAEYNQWFEDHINFIETATNMNELSKIYKGMVRKLDLRKDEGGKLKATRAKDNRKAELGEKNDSAA